MSMYVTHQQKKVTYDYITRGHLGWLPNGPVVDLSSQVPYSIRSSAPSYRDYRTYFIHDKEDRFSVAYKLLTFLGPRFNDLHPDLRKMEFSEIDKIGPLSIKMPVSYREARIQAYFNRKNFYVNGPVFLQAVSEVCSLLPKGRLRPRSLENVYKEADKTTNWGPPENQKGNISGEDQYNVAKAILNNPYKFPYPCQLGFRGQASGTGIPSQRVVWQYPHSIVLLELTFQSALLPILREMKEFAMLKSFDSIENEITRLMNKSLRTRQPLIGFDASAFDSSVPAELVLTAFYILKQWFQSSSHPMLDCLCDYFLKCGLYVNGSFRDGRYGGVPSGSGLTNLIDNLVQCILHKYISLTLGVDGEGTFMGDDGVWFVPGLTPDMLSDLLKPLGFTCNPAKVSFDQYYVTFCQRMYHVHYRSSDGVIRGIRSLFRTLNGMMSRERNTLIKRLDLFDSCRWISQLENCKNHPLFENMVEFSINRDLDHYLGIHYPGGPQGLFTDFGLSLFMEKSGKGFLYTSEVRKESDIPKLVTVKTILKLRNKLSFES